MTRASGYHAFPLTAVEAKLMSAIVLTTINAQYIHASLGLRYLLANLGDLRGDTRLLELTLEHRPIDIVEQLLAHDPKIVALGVYIWNIEPSTQLVALLKQVRPDIVVVLGGPEVSYEWGRQRIVELADYLITGPGDVAFPQLCAQLLAGEKPASKIIAAEMPSLDTLTLPYREYTDEDLKNRLIYVEASRGCPFKCEFCLSSLDKTAWPFELERFLGEMQDLYARGARHFKFVDRTFNLNVKVSKRILDFFLERMQPGLFAHFEMIPDHLPEALKESIARFPPGSLQFEVGIQSFDVQVQALISRKQNDAQTEANLRWLRDHTHAHIHADLIAGLPSETLDSFARGFDRLVAMGPHEIQMGILKRLRGTPIIRHTETFQMKYNPQPPYNVLSTSTMDFSTLQRINRFARYWDMIGNSGRFVHSRPVLLGAEPFARFMKLSDWIFATTGQTHRIALDRLFELVHDGMAELLDVPKAVAVDVLTRDYFECGARGSPKFLITAPRPTATDTSSRGANTARRQERHRRK